MSEVQKTEVQKTVVDSTKDVQKIGENDAASWQMDVVEFDHNGCLINRN